MMAQPDRGFPEAEFRQRLIVAQQKMADAEIDALLLTTEADVRYYSGFLTQFWQSPARPWFLILPQSGGPVAVIPGIGEQCMQRTWVTDIRCWSSPHPTDDGVSLLADALLEKLGSNGTLGLQMGAETHLRMPLASVEALRARLDKTRVVDATELVQSQQQIKSAAEIDKIEYTCRAVSRAFARLPEIASMADAERAVFQKFKHQCLSEGVDDVSYLVGATGPAGYQDIISPPSARTIGSGDILILDTGCIFDGYFCDFDRNFAFGSVDQSTESAYRRVHDSIDAALQLARPGVSCDELFQCMQAIVSPGNHPDTAGGVGRMGHGLGMQLTETPSITDFDATVLTAGMVLTLEPGCHYGDGKMMVHEENIVVTETGCRLLTERAAESIPIIR